MLIVFYVGDVLFYNDSHIVELLIIIFDKPESRFWKNSPDRQKSTINSFKLKQENIKLFIFSYSQYCLSVIVGRRFG